MAFRNVDVGVKVLGGLVGFALVMALVSDGEPGNDAWGGGEAAEAGTGDGDGAVRALSREEDAWLAGEAAGGLPRCDGTAPFAVDGGTVRLPVHGPVTPLASPDCRLGPGGAGGEAVRALQEALVACNDRQVTVDGAYGPETERAVAAVQAAHGLGADGVYGPATRAALRWPAEDGEGATSCASPPAPPGR